MYEYRFESNLWRRHHRVKKIESNSVDLIVTDPPYNLNKDYGNNSDKLEFDEYLNFLENG